MSCTRCGRVRYEALEEGSGRPQRSFDLVTVTGLSRAAVFEARTAIDRLTQRLSARFPLL